jgi:hypothetical protein
MSGVSEMFNFSFFDYLIFMPSPKLFDLIPDNSCECQGFKNRHRPDSYRDTLPYSFLMMYEFNKQKTLTTLANVRVLKIGIVPIAIGILSLIVFL